MQKRLLIVEDEHGLRSNIHRFLATHGYEVEIAADGGTALRLLEYAAYDLVVLDLNLPDIDGSVLASHIRCTAPTTLVMIISAQGDLYKVLGLLRTSAYDYLAKPFQLPMLEQRIRIALTAGFKLHQQVGMRMEIQRQAEREELFIGNNSQASSIFAEIHKVSLGMQPLLITGEQGTGKQSVARLLHVSSRGKESNLIGLDAASLSPVQAHAQLMHFVSERSPGKYRSKRCSATLLIQNLQRLSPDLQQILHQLMINTEEYSGKTQTNARTRAIIVTAVYGPGVTQKDGTSLQQLVSSYKSKSSMLHLSALRERMEDLPFIADCLLTQARGHHGKPVFGVDTEAMRCLMSHSWPGNIKELRSVIEYGVRRCTTTHIGSDDLPAYLQRSKRTSVDSLTLH